MYPRDSSRGHLGIAASLLTSPAAAAIGMVTLALATVAILYWSTSFVDALSRERQNGLVANVLAQSAEQVAHDQEAVTVWDDTLRKLQEPRLDAEWMDQNLGIWLHDYYGHDAVYLVSPANEPIYTMRDGRRGKPQDFASVAEALLPLVGRLRETLRNPGAELRANQLSPTVTDILLVDGSLAIASAKPVVSDSGEIEQEPGSEFVHVAVRRLASGFADNLRDTYSLDGARFFLDGDLRPGEDAQPLISSGGRVVGHFAWRPFAPGWVVFERLAPVLLSLGALVSALVFMLMRRIARRTRELRESNAAVQHLAFHDVLTGLPNRALFEDRLNHALAVFRRTAERRVALLFLDLDRFKIVNDTLGHAAGDELIRAFAGRLSAVIRATDTAARLGGDEFAVIQTDTATVQDVEDLCERIIEAAAAPFLVGSRRVRVGVSIGVALAGRDGFSADELGRCADIALYEAKASGRGRYLRFTPAMDEPIRARQNAEQDMRAALEAGDQLSVVYQPTYSANEGNIVGAEALIRWQHPESGEVAPTVFIPVAEEIGLIDQLGEWVLARVCRDARDWPIGTVSINVSPVQLRNPHFAVRAIGIIGEAGIEPERIELEITETAVIEQTEQCARNLRLLREFGVRVALDDFGTGYSSFRHFHEFEVDRVKIDQTFVSKIDLSEGGSAIIQAIVDLARSSGFRTTAEGVETEEQRIFLERIGCDELQGYLLARPVGAGDIDVLLGVARRPRAAETPPRRSIAA